MVESIAHPENALKWGIAGLWGFGLGSVQSTIAIEMLPRGQIFYDASCGLCSASNRRFGRLTRRARFRWVPAQDPRARELLGLEEGQLPDELKLLTSNGRMLGGADALLHIVGSFWWGMPIWLMSKLPGVRPLLRAMYRCVAKYRHRISGVCTIPPSQSTKRAA